ncbi:tRNA dihydrouridine synthase DusB [Desulfallas thermosapovorans]|uniref:tRNA-dihydrouridine synthase n=1 Tax=Desulfallas thermosapovorans DSM 6562 TaxID=1121431 RepID=A0A5S4ZPX1_9FIRM|nr:tRNA dihydrouridine synthase DusB [Desulfallas thermosapovorans]TYO94626.1 tRNA-U20-dihydrouridine synthase [Desulfallas thermosapovorans DSM 6562]
MGEKLTLSNTQQPVHFKIGHVPIANPVVAAPMAGVTDRPFRILAAEHGCGLVYTEMISDQALIYGNPKTNILLDCSGEKGPISVQIFGSQVEYMVRAAEIVAGRGADIIDINMGCPTPKIVKNGEGAALMRNPELAARIVAAVVDRVDCPVTVKMRKGWDASSVNAVEFARLVVRAGASAVAVHGRTREQFYSGEADWDIIRQVREAVDVPVIGNGDVRTPRDAERMLRQTGCQAVMIGRAAAGNPWIFSRTLHYLATGQLLPEPTPQMRRETAIRHYKLLVETKGEDMANRQMRKHLAWYTRGLRGAAALRARINQGCSYKFYTEEFWELLQLEQCMKSHPK